MKIAITHVDLPNESRGGVAYQVHYLANELASRGHNVTMFTFSPHFTDCLYKVHRYALAPKLRRFQSFFLAAFLSRTDFSSFDVIHSHGDNYLLWGRHPQVRTFHGSARDEAASAVSLKRRLNQYLGTFLERVGACVADWNVGVSQATRIRIPKVETIVPCGVDTRLFHPGAKSQNPTVLFVGTSGGRKRGNLLAEVFCKEIRFRHPSAQLWAVSESPLKGEGIVNFGKIELDHLTELFRQAWVFCLPSTYEGFGVPYAEALASGTAVVSSPNPGAQEVLEQGRFGIIAEDSQLGAEIGRLLQDRSKREDFEIRGLPRSREFDWSHVASRYEELYRATGERCAASGRVAIVKNSQS